MRNYELVLIINPDLDEDETNALVERVKGMIESGEGKILKIDLWGSKRLAYPIRRHTDGYYVLYIFESQPGAISQLNNSLRLIEPILRYMIVLFEGDIEKVLPSVNNVPQEADAQPQEEDAQPQEEDAQPQEEDAQPQEEDAQPQEEDAQPQEEDAQPQEEDEEDALDSEAEAEDEDIMSEDSEDEDGR